MHKEDDALALSLEPVAESASKAIGWVTNIQGRHALATPARPPVLVLGAMPGQVGIGYCLDMVRMPVRHGLHATQLQSRPLPAQQRPSVHSRSSLPPTSSSSSADEPVLPSLPPAMHPRISSVTKQMHAALLRHTHVLQSGPTTPLGLAILHAAGTSRLSAETHLHNGNMLYANPEIVRPWYMQPKSRRSCSALFTGCVKSQFSLWEVCIFNIAALIHIILIIIRQYSGHNGDPALSNNEIDQAIVSQGAISLPIALYTGSFSGTAAVITAIGFFALMSQLVELITLYVIASGSHLAVIVTSTGTTINLIIPMLQAIMLYCAIVNRSRHYFSIIIADTTF